MFETKSSKEGESVDLLMTLPPGYRQTGDQVLLSHLSRGAAEWDDADRTKTGPELLLKPGQVTSDMLSFRPNTNKAACPYSVIYKEFSWITQ